MKPVQLQAASGVLPIGISFPSAGRPDITVWHLSGELNCREAQRQ